MIRLIQSLTQEEQDALVQYCEQDALGLKTAGPFISYGFDKPFTEVWELINESGARKAVISRYEGDACITAPKVLTDDEILELREFMKAVGYVSLTATPEITGKAADGLIMVKTAADSNEEIKEDISWLCNDGYREFFDCTVRNYPDISLASFSDWYVDFSHRVRHGTAAFVMLKTDGAVHTVGAALNVLPGSVLMGAFASDEAYRGRGYAHAVIARLSDMYKSKKKYLMCMPDKQSFYEKAGWEFCGNFSVCNKGELQRGS